MRDETTQYMCRASDIAQPHEVVASVKAVVLDQRERAHLLESVAAQLGQGQYFLLEVIEGGADG